MQPNTVHFFPTAIVVCNTIQQSLKQVMDDCTLDEFQDCIKEIVKRYDEVKSDVESTRSDIVTDDIKYLDTLVASLHNFRVYKLDEYLVLVSDIARSLYYFQSDTSMVYSIPLHQLITYVNVFFNSCMCKFKALFAK